jgi:hypothetical protein
MENTIYFVCTPALALFCVSCPISLFPLVLHVACVGPQGATWQIENEKYGVCVWHVKGNMLCACVLSMLSVNTAHRHALSHTHTRTHAYSLSLTLEREREVERESDCYSDICR